MLVILNLVLDEDVTSKNSSRLDVYDYNFGGARGVIECSRCIRYAKRESLGIVIQGLRGLASVLQDGTHPAAMREFAASPGVCTFQTPRKLYPTEGRSRTRMRLCEAHNIFASQSNKPLTEGFNILLIHSSLGLLGFETRENTPDFCPVKFVNPG